MRKFCFFWVVYSLTFSPVLFATPSSDRYLNVLLETATEKGIASDQTWLKLLHFEPSASANSGFRSAIRSDDFFLSEFGSSDAAAELQATIRAFFDVPETNSNGHAQCQFAGRFYWLSRKLNIDESKIPVVECSDFINWSLNNSVESLSIVFATGYLGNPASYYGHTLLKLNSGKNKSLELLDVSVNYGAIVPDNENPLSYIVKGLVGGYDAGFSHVEYYYHTHNYGENELRDLWEYELNLSKPEVDFIVAHAWEVLGREYTYYFLRKNCAYRMAELFEIVEGIELIPDSSFWVMPQAIIQKLSISVHDDRPLLRQVKYHPSRQSRLYEKYTQLNRSEKHIVHLLVTDPAQLQAAKFSGLSLVSQQLILDTLLDYYQYVRDPQALSADEANERYREVLAKRYKLPPGRPYDANSIPEAPHSGRKGSYNQLTLVNNSRRNEGALFKLRPAYYDLKFRSSLFHNIDHLTAITHTPDLR